MKRILLIANTSWYLYNFRKSLIETLLNNDYRVLCVAPYDEYSTRLKNLGVEFITVEYDNSNLNPLKDIFFLFKLILLFRKQNPDIILSYTIKANIYGGIAARCIKKPFVANISGLGSLFIKRNLIANFSIFLYRLALKNAAKVFFQNNDDYKFFKKNNIIKNQNVDVLPGSGVDLTKFSSNKPKKDNKNFVFLFASRLLKDKGIVECVEAAKILKDKDIAFELRVLGKIWPQNPSSIKQHELDNWINSGLISYLGFTDDIRPYIEDADVILLPSYREGMSRILLEAASMSKPLIATNITGCKEVIEDGLNGYLCNVRDSYDLSKKMFNIIKLSNHDRLMMGKSGRKKMEQEFDEKVVIKKYLETIKELL